LNQGIKIVATLVVTLTIAVTGAVGLGVLSLGDLKGAWFYFGCWGGQVPVDLSLIPMLPILLIAAALLAVFLVCSAFKNRKGQRQNP